jgi:phosphoglycolate phosphatase
MRLVLFDIDGTLLTDNGASRGAFREALRDIHGYDGDLTRYDFSGRTDPQIARMVLDDANIPSAAIDAGMPRLWEHYLAGLKRNTTSGRVRVLPGVRALVEALAAHAEVALALLTGNIEPGARIKLAGAELGDFFPFGAFGSDSADRNELPPIAAQRAAAHLGLSVEGSDVVIIGDSIYDVRCGTPYGATTIAVASGKTPADKLRAENPRHFFDSAEDLDGMMRAIVA